MPLQRGHRPAQILEPKRGFVLVFRPVIFHGVPVPTVLGLVGLSDLACILFYSTPSTYWLMGRFDI